MPKRIWKISGKVIDQATGGGLSGLTVELWDWDFQKAGGNIWDRPEKAWDESVNWHDRIAVSTTDADGGFYFEFDEDAYRDLYTDVYPDLYFKVYRDGVLLKNTSDDIRNQVQTGEQYYELKVDPGNPTGPGTLLAVKGNVSFLDGVPAQDIWIRAFDKNFQSETELGDAATGVDGEYRIQFPKSKLEDDKDLPNLIVRAYETKEAPEPLVSSELFIKAPPSAIVDLTFPKASPDAEKSDYQKVNDALAEDLQGVALEDLTPDDFAVLADKVDIPVEKAMWYASARICSRKSGIATEVFYGMFAFEVPTDLDSMSTRPREVLDSALARASAEGIIAPMEDADRTAAIDALYEFFVSDLLQDETKNEFVKNLLSPAGVTEVASQKRFLELSTQQYESDEAFWNAIEGDGLFSSVNVDRLKKAIQIAPLTANNPQLTTAILDNPAVSDISDVLKLSDGDWNSLIGNQVPALIPGGTLKEQKSNYINIIKASIELRFPTQTLIKELGGSVVASFCDNHRDFDFVNQDVYEFIKDADITESDDTIKKVSGLQSLFVVAPVEKPFEFLKKLTEMQIDTLEALIRLGYEKFLEELSSFLGEDEARRTWHRAKNLESSTIFVAGRLFPPLALRKNNLTPIDYRQLFGSQDYYDVRHCDSVLGPAAYLVDLFEFCKRIDTSKRSTGFDNAFDELEDRRPDITKVHLTCDNTNVALPYVDVVNETLERELARARNLGGSADIPQTTIGDTFKKERPGASPTALAAERSKELQAEPENVNKAVYNAGFIKDELYPCLFDLHREEARAYLGHIKLDRYRLMDALRKDAPDESELHITDSLIAREFLDLSQPEWEALFHDGSSDEIIAE